MAGKGQRLCGGQLFLQGKDGCEVIEGPHPELSEALHLMIIIRIYETSKGRLRLGWGLGEPDSEDSPELVAEGGLHKQECEDCEHNGYDDEGEEVADDWE